MCEIATPLSRLAMTGNILVLIIPTRHCKHCFLVCGNLTTFTKAHNDGVIYKARNDGGYNSNSLLWVFFFIYSHCEHCFFVRSSLRQHTGTNYSNPSLQTLFLVCGNILVLIIPTRHCKHCFFVCGNLTPLIYLKLHGPINFTLNISYH